MIKGPKPIDDVATGYPFENSQRPTIQGRIRCVFISIAASSHSQGRSLSNEGDDGCRTRRVNKTQNQDFERVLDCRSSYWDPRSNSSKSTFPHHWCSVASWPDLGDRLLGQCNYPGRLL